MQRDVWANAQAQGCDDLDHERDIPLAIHAAIPDLIRDTNRSNPHKPISMRMRTAVASAAEPGLQVKADPMNSVSRHTGWRRLLHGLSETVRVELTGEAYLAGKDTNPNHRSEASVANRKTHSMTDSMTDNEIATNSHKLPEVP